MNQEQIKQWIKESHDNAVDKGFYECPECGGYGANYSNATFNSDDGWDGVKECKTCHGTKINPNKNIGELLMLIISELGEALEAHRCGRFADWESYETQKNGINPGLKKDAYKNNIKGSCEEEIADVFIRLFDLCGYMDIDLTQFDLAKHKIKWLSIDNVGDDLYRLTQCITKVRYYENQKLREWFLFHFYAHLINFASRSATPIEKHIEAKIAYNKTRPHKHNKEY